MQTIVRRRYLWIVLSLLTILIGAIFLGLYGLRTGVDFAGGALWTVQIEERALADLNTEALAAVYADAGFEGAQVQLSTNDTGTPLAVVRTQALSSDDQGAQTRPVLEALQQQYGTVSLASLESVGETVSQQSRLYAFFAVLGASVAILLYLTISYRKAPHPIRYGICTIIAMLHDVLITIATAAIFGQLIGLEVDALFLTALLTVIAFSVQDKIVVFDRIRENLAANRSGQSFADMVNLSIAQVTPRSICTQLTSLFTLTALLLFGGFSIQDFVIILLVGLLCGTYSSIFIAAPLLVVWENREWRTWFGRGRTAESASAA